MLGLLLVLFASCLQVDPPAQAPEVVTETWENGKPKSSHEVIRFEGKPLWHGKAKTYHENGQLESEGEYLQGERSGNWMFRWPNGRKREYGTFIQGLREGKWMQHDEKGWLEAQGKYVRGFRDGHWNFYLDSKRSVDTSRSGKYGHHAAALADGSVHWEGETFEGKKHGVWVARRPSGATMYVGAYDRGTARGPWAFFHSDGSFDPEFLSGEFDENGRRAGSLSELPESLKPYAPALVTEVAAIPWPSVDPQAAQALQAWLDAPEEARAGLRARLLETPKNALGAATTRLVALDLQDPAQEAIARRISEGIVAAILGARPDWSAGEAQSAEKNRRTCLRLLALYETASMHETPWKCLLNPKVHWIEGAFRDTLITMPPFPAAFLEPIPRGVDWKPKAKDSEIIGIGGGRGPANRPPQPRKNRRVKMLGGDGVELPFEAALDWIVANQEADGSWSPAKHGGDDRVRRGVTAQCLLALLSDRNTPDEGEFAAQVLSAMEWLVRAQDPVTGRYDDAADAELWQHLLSLHANVEASVMTRWPVLKESARRGVRALGAARLADGSWPHCDADRVGDPATTAKALFVVLLAEEAGIEIDRSWIEAGLAWLDARSEPELGWIRVDESAHPRSLAPKDVGAATGATLLAKRLAGWSSEQCATTTTGLVRLLGEDPANPAELSLEAWEWGGLALFQIGGRSWDRWNKVMKPRMVDSPVTTGPLSGSWPPGAQDAVAGGRLQATALRALTLATYFRYTRISPGR